MPKNFPFFSIIIIYFNGQTITEDCVESILRSQHQDFEIILVDNGSKDKSFAYFQKKYKHNNKVRNFRIEINRHVTGGYNFGAKQARGQKLIFMNNDIEVDTGWLTELGKVALKHSDILQPRVMSYSRKEIIDCLGGKYVFPGLGIGIGCGEKYSAKYSDEIVIDYACSITFMIDKKLFKQAGGFDEWFKFYYEDVDLCFRAKKLGAKCWYCPKSVLYHKGSLTVSTKERPTTVGFHVRKNRYQTIKKNFTGLDKSVRLASLYLVDKAIQLYTFCQRNFWFPTRN